MRRIGSRELRRMMKKMGIEGMENLDVEEVIFIYRDGRKTRIASPNVSKIAMGDTTIYQVVGKEEDYEEESKMEFSEEDIAIVMEQANVDRELAIKALELTQGDIAGAIIALKEGGLSD